MKNGDRSRGRNDHLRQLSKVLDGDMERLIVLFRLYENAFVDGALPSKVKYLIALALAIVERGSQHIIFHVNEAMEAGASRGEIKEAVTIAAFVGGVPSLLSAAEALAAVARFEAQKLVPSA